MKTITAKDLTTYLKEKLVGTNFGWDFGWDILQQLRAYLKEQKIPEKIIQNINYQTSKYSKQTITLVYNKQPIGYIDAKKAKGQKHYSWLSQSYFEWTFKDLNVVFYKEDLAASIDSANEANKKINDRQLDIQDKATDVYKELLDKYSEQDIKDVVKYIYEHSWTIVDLVKEKYYAQQ